MKKVLLIVPPQEIGYGYINDFFWQQGLLYLTAHLKKIPQTSVKIIDGNIHSIKDCMAAVEEKYDIIGIHAIDHTRKYALQIARHAIKQGNKKIIFGGAGAMFGPKQYLNIEGAVIGCCNGPGEFTMVSMLMNKDLKDVPNLIYKENNKIVSSKIKKGRPNVDYTNLPFECYGDIELYLKKQISTKDYPYPPMTYSALSHEGCIHRVRIGNKIIKGCTFCGIPAERFSPRDAKKFWKEIELFEKYISRFDYNLKSIKDWGDSITPGLLRELLEARPENMKHIKYSCYLSISEIKSETLELLKELNCFSVYIGIDGITNLELRRIKKDYSSTRLVVALDLLKKYDFNLEVGFVLGKEGETKISLNNTVKFARLIINIFKNRIIVIQGNILIPYPGSAIFDTLKKECDKDLIFLSVRERIKLWLEKKTQVTFEDCVNSQKRIEMISPRKHSYACTKNE